MLFGGLKLASVGFISSIGAVAASNVLYAIRRFLNPALVANQRTKRSPILKTAVVYGCFLGTSANLRYQVERVLISDACTNQLYFSIVIKTFLHLNNLVVKIHPFFSVSVTKVHTHSNDSFFEGIEKHLASF